MPKKLKPSEDPSLFDYEPHEDEVPDEEMCATFYAMKTDPKLIDDEEFRAKYEAYIEAQKNAQ